MKRKIPTSSPTFFRTKCVKLLLLPSRFSRVWLCVTPQTAAHQAPPSLGFSRQEYWSELPFPSPVHETEKWKWSHSVVSDSSRPHGLQPTRLLHPWDFPGKSTGYCWCQVASVVSYSVRPHRQQPTRLPPPRQDSPGKNTGVGCHFLLQCMKLKSESEVTQSCLTLSDPMDCSLPGSSIHEICQARVLEWVAIAFSVYIAKRFN